MNASHITKNFSAPFSPQRFIPATRKNENATEINESIDLGNTKLHQ